MRPVVLLLLLLVVSCTSRRMSQTVAPEVVTVVRVTNDAPCDVRLAVRNDIGPLRSIRVSAGQTETARFPHDVARHAMEFTVQPFACDFDAYSIGHVQGEGIVMIYVSPHPKQSTLALRQR